MPARINIIGEVFGRLLVISDAPPFNGRRRVLCQCDCGKSVSVDPRQLRFGKTKSCGCYQREAVSKSQSLRITHGMSKTREYNIWKHVISRCENTNNAKYRDYGGRGIKVCKEWRNSFQEFIADMGLLPSGMNSIDRIDVDGDYEKSNCRWANNEIQSTNKRNTVVVIFEGKEMALSQACKESGVNYQSARYRLSKGKPWMPLPKEPS